MWTSSLEQIKAVVRRYVDEYQVGAQDEVAIELLAEDFVHHSGPGWSNAYTGRQSATMFATLFRAAFPDLEVVIHAQIAEGDTVVTRKSYQGTHRGEFIGVPATGKRVAIDAIDIIRIAEGRMTEHWVIVDLLAFMQQVGVLTPPGSGAAKPPSVAR